MWGAVMIERVTAGIASLIIETYSVPAAEKETLSHQYTFKQDPTIIQKS